MEKENKLKSIFLSLSPVTVIMWLKDAEIKYWKEFGKTILSIIAPLLIIFLMINTLLLIGTFVIWRWPDHFYLPFYGGKIQSTFDRLMLLVGVVIAVFKKDW